MNYDRPCVDLPEGADSLSVALRHARDDATAIVSSFGAIAEMVMGVAITMEHYVEMIQSREYAGNDNLRARDVHGPTAYSIAELLDRNRRRIEEILNDIGDWHNGHDSCCEFMVAMSTPVFEMHQLRSRDRLIESYEPAAANTGHKVGEGE